MATQTHWQKYKWYYMGLGAVACAATGGVVAGVALEAAHVLTIILSSAGGAVVGVGVGAATGAVASNCCCPANRVAAPAQQQEEEEEEEEVNSKYQNLENGQTTADAKVIPGQAAAAGRYASPAKPKSAAGRYASPAPSGGGPAAVVGSLNSSQEGDGLIKGGSVPGRGFIAARASYHPNPTGATTAALVAVTTGAVSTSTSVEITEETEADLAATVTSSGSRPGNSGSNGAKHDGAAAAADTSAPSHVM